MPQLKRALSRAATVASKRARTTSARRKRGLAMPSEYKTHLIHRSGATLVANADMTGAEVDPSPGACLNAMVQGTSENTRIGRTVRNVSLEIKGSLRLNMDDASSTTEKPWCFVALVRDKRTAGAQLNSEDVYTNTAGATDTIPACLRNPDFRQRFDVLAFKQVTFYQGQMGQTHQLEFFDWYVPLNDTTNYNANAGTVADINDVSYHVIAASTDAVIGTAGNVKINYNAKLTFEG